MPWLRAFLFVCLSIDPFVNRRTCRSASAVPEVSRTIAPAFRLLPAPSVPSATGGTSVCSSGQVAASGDACPTLRFAVPWAFPGAPAHGWRYRRWVVNAAPEHGARRPRR